MPGCTDSAPPAPKLARLQGAQSYEWQLTAAHDDYGKSDLNGDELTDICGVNETGVHCALNGGGIPFGETVPWTELFGDINTPSGWWFEPDNHMTIRFPDIDGNGVADVCGRSDYGIVCAYGTGDGFYPYSSWWIETPLFSNYDGWHLDPRRYGSIRFIDINGDGRDDVCGREATGFSCYASTGNGFDLNYPTHFGFTDSAWGTQDAWVTLAFVDVNGDRLPDVCGRHPSGIVCAENYGYGFQSERLWTSDFGNAQGWQTSPALYSTIRFPDVNGDGLADVCGRYFDGIRCAFNSGFGTFYPATLWSDSFSDADGWSTGAEYYSTIQYVDVTGDGKADVCGRDADGIVCAVNTACAAFEPATVWASHFTDAAGWNADAAYFSTLRFVDVNGDQLPDVCGRGSGGMECALNEVMQFGEASVWSSSFSDAAGWPDYYGTIRFPTYRSPW